MRSNKKSPLKSDKTQTLRTQKRGVVGYSRKTALLEEAITQMNAGKYGRSSAALKELLALDPVNMEARRLFATLHLRLGSLIPAKQAFDSLITEAFQRQDYWLAESLLREYLAAGPRCVPFLEKLGSIYQEKGDTLEAVGEYGKAIDILIEDPDPENPHQAAQLYAKIRQLAPASPIAFRLASFFDAETGELLARPPGSPETSSTAAAPVIGGEDQSEQAGPQVMGEAMPWDIQDSSEVVDLPSETSPLPEVPLSSAQSGTNNIDLIQEARPPDTDRVSSSMFVTEPAERSPSDVHPDVPVEPSVPEMGAAPAEEKIHQPLTPAADGNPQPSVKPTEPKVKIHEEQLGPHSELSLSNTSASPKPAESKSSLVGSDAEGATTRVDLAKVFHSPMSPSENGATLTVVPTLQTEAEPAHAFLSAESSTSTPIQEPDTEPSSHAAQLDTLRTEAPSLESESSPLSQPVTSEPSEPWKQPGFSWESVFNSAWKFSDLHPVKDSPSAPVATSIQERAPAISSPEDQRPEDTSFIETPEREVQSPSQAQGTSGSSVAPMPWDQVQESTISIPPVQPDSPIVESSVPTRLEETIVEAPAISSSLDQQEDNPSIEIPERDAQSSSKAEVVSGSSIAPMPWDQVQESTISIPPVQADPPMVENMEQAVDQSPDQAESNWTPQDDDTQPQPPLSPSTLTAEQDSFSLVQDSPIALSPEQPISAGGTGEISAATEGTDHLVESEPLFRFASSPTIEESSTLEEPAVAQKPPVHSSAPIVDTLAGQENVHSLQADALSGTEETQAAVHSESIIQKAEVESRDDQSQPVEDVADARTEDIQVSLPPPSQHSVVASTSESAAAPAVSQGTPEDMPQNDQLAEVAFVETRTPIPEPVSPQEEWVNTSASIRFIHDPPVPPMAPVSPAISEQQEGSRPLSVAAAAVDVLFESSENITPTETREHGAETKPSHKSGSMPSRTGLAITGFVHSCFSTTRSIITTLIGLVVLSGLFVALGIGAIALTWIIMEEPPSAIFQSFTTTPQRALSDPKKNAYTLLLGIDSSAGHDPLQDGSDRKPEAGDGNTALTCFGTPGAETGDRSNASASVMRGWVRRSDPLSQFKSHHETIKGWGSQHQSAMERYSQWQKLPFEDWGYGQPVSPPCAAMAFAHQLHVADGFVEGSDIGVDRLETDMETWRVILSQARTLPVKMLALQAINDDIAVASGMLVGSDFDGKYLGRITKFLRPLDQGELSIRWPMQSELVSALKTYENQLKVARSEEQSLYTTVASVLPLPKQQRLNAYAKYYEASYKVAGERQYGSLPKWKDYIHFPAAGITDFLTNPIENIVGFEPLPAWDVYNGLTVDTDAHLRLASLQAWLRRGSSESDLLTRIAKAGQGFYDPYTGLPMLVNMKKGALYSVGHDGKDQDADPQSDVVVEIPRVQTSGSSTKPSGASSKSR